MRLARVLGAVGRTLITAGVLILLFVVYQLWGTGIRHAQSQERLADEFAEPLASAEDDAPPTTTPPEPPAQASTTPTTAETGIASGRETVVTYGSSTAVAG